MIAPIVFALLPIGLLIAFGHLMRRYGFLPDAFWPPAERLSYFVLLPCLFIHGLATADLSDVAVAPLAGALLISTLMVAAVLVAFSGVLADNGPAFTSVFQGGIRFNNYVGVTAALGLFGMPGLALAAVANAVIVPTVNILCVLVFARHGGARPTVLGVLRDVATNPLVAACAIGILLQGTGLGLPPGLEGAIKALGQASLPLGLLCVGAALNWEALGQGIRPTLNASVAKFVLMPLAAAATCLWFGLDARSTTIAVLFQALPTASSSYLLARQLGGDARLMAGIITFQTMLAILTVPAVLLLMQSVL